MTIHIIKLSLEEWKYDDDKPLGKPGGFGEVFLGYGRNGAVAIKRLKVNVAQVAYRELNISQKLMNRNLKHVVPVIDAGQDSSSDQYFIVMPVCEYSLQDKIYEANGRVDLELASAAILAIITGLLEVSDITHRDLKPANILFHEGAWKIADFGIAKFVEDSTSLLTLRNSLTPPYAAPEQWLGERPTFATDVYALGCIIHVLINGKPPFVASTVEEYRELHLYSVPPTLDTLPPRIAQFVAHMLRKPQQVRPTLERCATVLSELNAVSNSSSLASPLGEAAKIVAALEAQEEANKRATEISIQQHTLLISDATRELSSIIDRLFNYIKDASESAKIISGDSLTFGKATLRFHIPSTRLNQLDLLQNSSKLKILTWARVELECDKSPHTSYLWSASLLFAKFNDDSNYRWYEVAFWSWGRNINLDEPFYLPGDSEDLLLALDNVMHSINVAYGPFLIDAEDEQSFIDRWVKLTAQAAVGKLDKPSQMPMRNFK